MIFDTVQVNLLVFLNSALAIHTLSLPVPIRADPLVYFYHINRTVLELLVL